MNNQLQKLPSTLERVVQVLRTEVCGSGRQGERLATIAALAARLGVSTNTVRSALTILQQEGLVDLRHGSGTYVRQAPRAAKHVALVAEIDLLHPVISIFFKEMFRHLRNLLLAAGHDVRLYTGDAAPALDGPRYSQVAGRQVLADLDRIRAVAAFVMLADELWVAPLRARGIPIVSNVPELGPSVCADREGMVRQAVAALAARGCRRAGFISWGIARGVCQGSGDGTLEWLFARTAAEWGLETRQEWVCTTGHPSEPGAGWEAFRDIWRRSSERPDGVVIIDDQLLPGVFEALRGSSVPAGLRPLLATHFNEGNPLQAPWPLIKLVYSPEAHAQAMADLIVGALDGTSPANRLVTLPHRLVLPKAGVAVATPDEYADEPANKQFTALTAG